ncbi:MAG: hypothetical protein NUW37_03025 [Planctomycetes bacterium]|nr:hypothetical protein [Planctomycetota bacterium]
MILAYSKTPSLIDSFIKWFLSIADEGDVVFLGQIPNWLLIGIIVPLLLFLSFYGVKKAETRNARIGAMAAAVVFRGFVVFLIAMLISGVALLKETPREQASVVVILIDDSLSMSIRDAYLNLPDESLSNYVSAAEDGVRNRTEALIEARGTIPDLAKFRELREQEKRARAEYVAALQAAGIVREDEKEEGQETENRGAENQGASDDSSVGEALDEDIQKILVEKRENLQRITSQINGIVAPFVSENEALDVSARTIHGGPGGTKFDPAARYAAILDRLASDKFGVSRRELALTTLLGPEYSGEDGLLASLGKAGHEVWCYSVCGDGQTLLKRIEPAALESETSSAGSSSPLGDAISLLRKDLRGRKLAGVVLISDGRETKGRMSAQESIQVNLRGDSAEVPFVVIGVGDPREPTSAMIVSIDAPRQVRFGDAIPITAEILASDDLKGESLAFGVTLAGEAQTPERIFVNGALVEEQSLVLEGNERTSKVTVEVNPELKGTLTLTFSIEAKEGDRDLDDNVRTVTVEVIDKRMRVLYIEGRPRFEWRHLVNALKRDTQIEFQGFLASAEEGWANPVSMENEEEIEPLKKLPQTLEEFEKYDAMIFGDVDPSVFSREAWDAIETWVSDGSASIVFLPGRTNDVFRDNVNMPRTMLNLLPFSSSSAASTDGIDFKKEHFLTVNKQSRSHPIFRLGGSIDGDLRMFEVARNDPTPGLGGFYWFLPVEKLKPAAKILAEIKGPTDREPFPAIVEQPYGSGKSFWIASDEIWRWRWLHGDRYYYRFWQNVLRYLTSFRLGTQDQGYSIDVLPAGPSVGEPARLIVTIGGTKERAELFGETRELAPKVSISGVPPYTDREESIELGLSDPETGVYEGSYAFQRAGSWLLSIPGIDESMLRPKTVEVSIPASELTPPNLAWTMLHQVATETSAGDPIDEVAFRSRVSARSDVFEADGDRLVFRPDEAHLIDFNKASWSLPPISEVTKLDDNILFLYAILGVLIVDWIIRKLCRLP